MVFSSAFAANLAVMFCLIKGQSADSVVDGNVLVVSDALNHRSIIDGIRLPNLAKEQKQIFKHLDTTDLDRILQENIGKWSRILVVTDGVFSMLGEYQDLSKLRAVIDKYDDQYPNGVLLVVDDCHGIAACGQTGRGVEEIFGAKADVLVGTFGKGFGADGGYVVANQTIIDYLRESAATYIYSNSISPGTAGAALAAVQLLDDADGQKLLAQSRANVAQFKQAIQEAGFSFAAQSSHPIQPLLIGDAAKARALTEGLFAAGFIVTNLSYPVVTKGRDEIRVQISAAQEATDITAFVAAAAKVGREVGII
jgi:glycine C-acetyltransferase